MQDPGVRNSGQLRECNVWEISVYRKVEICKLPDGTICSGRKGYAI